MAKNNKPIDGDIEDDDEDEPVVKETKQNGMDEEEADTEEDEDLGEEHTVKSS